MKNICFNSLLIFTLTLNEFEFSASERRTSQEEWQQMRFDGMGSGQWTMNIPNTDSETLINSGNTQMDATLQTNIETVDVGRDKLVLVNDQGSIRMLRASQLPTIAKQNTEVTTQTPSTVIQMPLEQYLTKDSNQNPTKNPIEIITPNFGAGHRVAGLPVAFATSSNSMERPNVVYQTDSNPCVKGSDNPPIYIPAPQVSASTSRSSDKKMVRIIIEMPESMTRNPDEASRYAATQVKRLRVPDEKPRRKIKKNVQEMIRKVVQTEEENDEQEEQYSNSSNEDMVDEASNANTQNNMIIAKTSETDDNGREKKYILVRKSGRLRRRDRGRNDDNLKAIDKYKKIIKVYRN